MDQAFQPALLPARQLVAGLFEPQNRQLTDWLQYAVALKEALQGPLGPWLASAPGGGSIERPSTLRGRLALAIYIAITPWCDVWGLLLDAKSDAGLNAHHQRLIKTSDGISSVLCHLIEMFLDAVRDER